jgi:hypothetical protein
MAESCTTWKLSLPAPSPETFGHTFVYVAHLPHACYMTRLHPLYFVTIMNSTTSRHRSYRFSDVTGSTTPSVRQYTGTLALDVILCNLNLRMHFIGIHTSARS